MKEFSRTAILIGEAGVERLKKSSVAIIGLGGVGGFCVEALARAGVGRLLLCDGDVVSESNINRQLIALNSNVGQKKSTLFKNRVLDINPRAKIVEFCDYLDKFNVNEMNLGDFDYVVDCIDSITDKLDLIEFCFKNGIRIISSMGAGNRLSADFKVADIFSTHSCPLAKVMRKALRERGVTQLKTVFSPMFRSDFELKFGENNDDFMKDNGEFGESFSDSACDYKFRGGSDVGDFLCDYKFRSDSDGGDFVCDYKFRGGSDGGDFVCDYKFRSGSDVGDFVCDYKFRAGELCGKKRAEIGSISYVPPLAGLILAQEVIKSLLK